MTIIRVTEYLRKDGSSPFKSWFDGLDVQAAAKVAAAVMKLELGNNSNVKDLGRIAEYRIHWGPGYRIYLGRDGHELIILLGGGTKKHQDKDIERAEVLFAEYKTRKAQSCKG